MATPHQATVTAKTGPNVQITAAVITNVMGISIDLVGKKIQIQTDTTGGNQIREYELTPTTTLTFTNTAGTVAIVIA